MEFLRYPQIIPYLFNGSGFGPPRDFTPVSTCPWVGHPVSGLQRMTYRPIKTRFPCGSVLYALNLAIHHNSPDRSTKSTPSSLNALRLLVNTGFQVLFHSPPGVLFTFPSRYCFTIGHQVVFRLGGWSPRLPTRFHVSRGTLDTGLSLLLSLTGLLPSVVSAFHPLILLESVNHYTSPQPHSRCEKWDVGCGISAGLRSLALILTSNFSPLTSSMVWPLPRSLAATYGISVDFFSCRYLDVSVPCVYLVYAMYSRIRT